MRVLVCDDHAMVRTGLEQLIATAPDMDLAGSARDGEEAVALCQELAPDVVLMDLVMPGLDGLEATRRIVSRGSGCRVLVLSAFSDRERIISALRAGAAGYVVKDMAADQLLDAIRATHRGERPLASAAAKEVVSQVAGQGAPRLTPRERQVLALVGDGLSNRAIAAQLGISVGTVKATLTNSYRRLGVDNRTNAALLARQHYPDIGTS